MLVTLAFGLRFDESDKGVEGEWRVVGRSGNIAGGGESAEFWHEFDHTAGILSRMKTFNEFVVPRRKHP